MSSHEATLEFAYQTTARARIVAESVRREIGEIDDARSQTTLERADRQITITIEARDLTALRAALNTWFSLVTVTERTATLGRQYPQS